MDTWRVSKPRECIAFQGRRCWDILGEAGENKRLERRHLRKKWGHLFFEVQKQCILKVLFEAVITAAYVPAQMKLERRGVTIKNCFQNPLY